MGRNFAGRIKKYVDQEIDVSDSFLKAGDPVNAFRHLERAHVLGQAVTLEHTRVHWLMLKIGWRNRDFREVLGQIFRVIGASTKTPLGIYPRGNTGGSNVSPFKSLPIPEDLRAALEKAGQTD